MATKPVKRDNHGSVRSGRTIDNPSDRRFEVEPERTLPGSSRDVMAKTMVLALILLLLAPASYATPVDVVATDGFIATGIFEEVLISISGSDFSLTALPPGAGIFWPMHRGDH